MTRLHPWMAVVFLLPGLHAQPQSRPTDMTEYTERARQAVRDWLAREAAIVLIGEPVFPPDHVHFHRQPFQVAAGESAVAGKVVNARWEPIPEARVSIASRSGTGKQAAPVVSDSNGSFHVRGLTPGVHRLDIQARGFQPLAEDDELASGFHRVIVRMNQKEELIRWPVTDLVSPGRKLTAKWLAALYRGEEWEFYEMQFDGLKPEVVDGHVITPDFPADMQPTTASERSGVLQKLAPFFEAWLDVSRGPERFRPFLAENVICFVTNSGTPVFSFNDDRRCASAVLEMFAFEAWFELEGNPRYPVPGSFFDDQPASSWEERILLSARAQALIRNEWLADGMFDASHKAALRPYLGVLLGEGNVLWEWKMPIPAGQELEELDERERAFWRRVSSIPPTSYLMCHESRCHWFFVFVPHGSELQLQLVFGGTG